MHINSVIAKQIVDTKAQPWSVVILACLSRESIHIRDLQAKGWLAWQEEPTRMGTTPILPIHVLKSAYMNGHETAPGREIKHKTTQLSSIQHSFEAEAIAGSQQQHSFSSQRLHNHYKMHFPVTILALLTSTALAAPATQGSSGQSSSGQQSQHGGGGGNAVGNGNSETTTTTIDVASCSNSGNTVVCCNSANSNSQLNGLLSFLNLNQLLGGGTCEGAQSRDKEK